MKSTPEPSHETLMARFQSRLDADAFEQIVCSYMNPALAVAHQILADQALAEDAVQESFLRIIRNRHRYVAGSPFPPWFYTIVRNVCLDMLRRGARHRAAIQEVAAMGRYCGAPDAISEMPAQLGLLARAEREVLVLRIVHGLRFSDVAAALGISEEAAKKRAQRGLRRLRAKLCDSKQSPGRLVAGL